MLAALLLSVLAPSSVRADDLRRVTVPAAGEYPARELHGISLRCRADLGADTFARTELFFGLSRPGGVVTEEDFKAFVDLSVTPRFPDGLTVLSGIGQFRDASGAIVKEGSKLLVLLYPRQDREAHRKIEQIRNDYKHQFQQQSVLRSDDLTCVSF